MLETLHPERTLNFRGIRLDKESMKKFEFDSLPCGFIVGKAKLVDVKEYKNDDEFNKDKFRHLATSDWGNFGFILEDAERIKPIPAKGNLNFWDFDLK